MVFPKLRLKLRPLVQLDVVPLDCQADLLRLAGLLGDAVEFIDVAIVEERAAAVGNGRYQRLDLVALIGLGAVNLAKIGFPGRLADIPADDVDLVIHAANPERGTRGQHVGHEIKRLGRWIVLIDFALLRLVGLCASQQVDGASRRDDRLVVVGNRELDVQFYRVELLFHGRNRQICQVEHGALAGLAEEVQQLLLAQKEVLLVDLQLVHAR